MKKNLKNMTVIGLVVGSLVLGSSFSVYAADTTTAGTSSNTSAAASSSQSKGDRAKGDHGKGFGRMQSLDVDTLVTDGVIDQTTADAITTYMTQLESEKKAEMEKVSAMTDTEKQAYFESQKSTKKTSLLDQLVSNSIITSDQETAIESAIKSSSQNQDNNKGQRGDQMGKLDVDTLVTDGVIDQTTADAITTYMTQLESEKKAEMEKVSAMTDTEKQAYFESQKSTKKTSLLDQLVSNSIITSDQETAIESAIKSSSQNQDNDKKFKGDHMGKLDVDTLVTDGVIDQTTADAITTYMTQLESNRKAEMEKVSAMTDTEKQAYFESQKSTKKTSLLDQLVSNSIITSDQETAIKAAMKKGNDNTTTADSVSDTTSTSDSDSDE